MASLPTHWRLRASQETIQCLRKCLPKAFFGVAPCCGSFEELLLPSALETGWAIKSCEHELVHCLLRLLLLLGCLLVFVEPYCGVDGSSGLKPA